VRTIEESAAEDIRPFEIFQNHLNTHSHRRDLVNILCLWLPTVLFSELPREQQTVASDIVSTAEKLRLTARSRATSESYWSHLPRNGTCWDHRGTPVGTMGGVLQPYYGY